MEIQPNLIRGENLEKLVAKYESFGTKLLNSSSEDCKNLIAHIKAQDKWIEELVTFRAAFFRLVTNITGLARHSAHAEHSLDKLENLIYAKYKDSRR